MRAQSQNEEYERNIFNNFKPEYDDEYVDRFRTLNTEEKQEQKRHWVK